VTRSDTSSRPLASLVIAICLAIAATPSWAGGEPAPAPPKVGRPRRAVARLKRLGPGLERFATQTSKELVAELKKLGPGFARLSNNPWLDPKMGEFIQFVKDNHLAADGPKRAYQTFQDFVYRKRGAARRKSMAEIFASDTKREEQATRQEYMRLLGGAGPPEELAEQLYRKENGARAIAQLKRLGLRFEQLVVHPGLVTRMSQFTRFVKRKGLQHAGPERALDAFREFLGTKIVYRALALPPGGVEEVLANGIESGEARADGRYLRFMATPRKDQMRWDLENGAPVDLPRAIHLRIRGGDNHDELLSVGEIPEAAIAAAGAFADDDRRIELFKLRVPALDVFHTGSSKSVLPDMEGPMTLRLNPSKNEIRYSYPNPAVESFILYKIGPEEIVDHQTIDPKNVPDYQLTNRPPTLEAAPR
jgi:hypothetical protein